MYDSAGAISRISFPRLLHPGRPPDWEQPHGGVTAGVPRSPTLLYPHAGYLSFNENLLFLEVGAPAHSPCFLSFLKLPSFTPGLVVLVFIFLPVYLPASSFLACWPIRTIENIFL